MVRRVDGRTLGSFFREEVAQPLGLDLHIGLRDHDFSRVADVSTVHARLNSPSDPERLTLEWSGFSRKVIQMRPRSGS